MASEDFKTFLGSAPDVELAIERPADPARLVDPGEDPGADCPEWTDRPVG